MKKITWELEPLDADRPFLEQLEEKVLNAPSEEEFEQGLKWLKRTYYQDSDKMSVLSDRRKLRRLKAL